MSRHQRIREIEDLLVAELKAQGASLLNESGVWYLCSQYDRIEVEKLAAVIADDEEDRGK